MKEYNLIFKDKEEAYSVLIPAGFGYNSISMGPTLFPNVIGEYGLVEVQNENTYDVIITFVGEINILKEELTPYVKEQE